MEQVEVEILGQVITAQYGTLSTGQILRTSPAFAKHLVEDCAAAKYRKATAPKSAAEPKPAKSAKAGKAVKENATEGAVAVLDPAAAMAGDETVQTPAQPDPA